LMEEPAAKKKFMASSGPTRRAVAHLFQG
jgi:hypothetical protein